MDIVELKARMDLARARRRNHEPAIQEISDLHMPFRGDITTARSPGDDRIDRTIGVFDPTGVDAADNFTNFLKSTIFPTNLDWLRFELPEPFEQRLTARRLADVTARRVLAGVAASNFYTSLDPWLRDDGVLGTGTMFVEALPPIAADGEGNRFGGFRFTAVPWGRVWFMTGVGDMPIFILRDMTIPAIAAKREFGSAGAKAEKAIRDGAPMELFTYSHVVWFNENGIAGGLRHPMERPWVSHWALEDSDGKALEILRTRGQDLNPYLIARWNVVDGEEYGRGQGHISRPAMKGLNKLRELVLDAAGVDLKPPFLVEDETAIDLDLGPGGTILVSPPQKVNPAFLPTGARYDVANQIGTTDRIEVRRAFLGDLLDDPEFQDRSAAAVRDRQRRAAQRLAPRADRIYSEAAVPLVSVALNRMAEFGALPELEALAAMGVREMGVVMTSPFFTAQKEAPLGRMAGWLEEWKRHSTELNRPELLDRINLDKAVEVSGRLSDVPSELINDDREVARIRQARQAILEENRRLEQAQQAAGVAKQIAGARDGG